MFIVTEYAALKKKNMLIFQDFSYLALYAIYIVRY